MSDNQELVSGLASFGADLMVIENGEYLNVSKLIAISYLESSLREWKGELIPAYREINRLLDVPEATLRYWWKKKEEIERSADAMIAAMPKTLLFQLCAESYRVLLALRKKKYEDTSVRDLTGLFQMLTQKMQVMFKLVPQEKVNKGGVTGAICPPAVLL